MPGTRSGITSPGTHIKYQYYAAIREKLLECRGSCRLRVIFRAVDVLVFRYCDPKSASAGQLWACVIGNEIAGQINTLEHAFSELKSQCYIFQLSILSTAG